MIKPLLPSDSETTHISETTLNTEANLQHQHKSTHQQRRTKPTWINHFQSKNNTEITKLKTIYTNIDSLLNKRQELIQIIELHTPLIICLTETLPKNRRFDVLDTEISIENFQLFTNHSNAACHRGVAVYIHNTLNATEVNTDILLNYDYISCEIKTKTSKLLLSVCYRSPNSSEEIDNQINLQITKDSQHYSDIVIVGDFNYPSIDWHDPKNPIPNSTKTEKFIESIRESFLLQHVFKPTHIRHQQNPTTIDLVFTSEENMVTSVKHLSPIGKSHHQLLLFNISTHTDTKSQQTQKYLFSRGNYVNIKNDLKLDEPNSLNSLDSEQLWDFFLKKNH